VKRTVAKVEWEALRLGSGVIKGTWACESLRSKEAFVSIWPHVCMREGLEVAGCPYCLNFPQVAHRINCNPLPQHHCGPNIEGSTSYPPASPVHIQASKKVLTKCTEKPGSGFRKHQET
jgi:hypothetical protein